MSVEEEGSLIGHFKLKKEKDGQEFIYEGRLFQHDITMDYVFQRRWNYSKKMSKTSWRVSRDWNLKDHKRFIRKFVQKTKIMNYEILDSNIPKDSFAV